MCNLYYSRDKLFSATTDVKKSKEIPVQALRAPGGWDSHIS
jgi:hypothetical protein